MLILGFVTSLPSLPFVQILHLPSIHHLIEVRKKIGQVGQVPFFVVFAWVFALFASAEISASDFNSSVPGRRAGEPEMTGPVRGSGNHQNHRPSVFFSFPLRQPNTISARINVLGKEMGTGPNKK